MVLKTGLQRHFVGPHTKETKHETTNENMHDFFRTAFNKFEYVEMSRYFVLLFCTIIIDMNKNKTLPNFRNSFSSCIICNVFMYVHVLYLYNFVVDITFWSCFANDEVPFLNPPRLIRQHNTIKPTTSSNRAGASVWKRNKTTVQKSLGGLKKVKYCL